ncbi:MAG TPA: DUF1080 domain-containing protein [Humisphaera sp.]|nr:DUF1080 domain-containing protein [Humisphaera sp.]
MKPTRRTQTNFILLLVALALFALCVHAGQSSKPTTQPQWQSLFDGRTLAKWVAVKFGGEGEVHVEDGSLVIEAGAVMSGANYTGTTPKMNYEVEMDARRVDGTDFFCGLTFPISEDFATLVLGGWGGAVCGISCLDDNDAARNDTRALVTFKKGQWYHIRLRVYSDRIQAWVDKEMIVDVDTSKKKISLRDEVEPSKPFGLATYQTTGAYKEIRLRPLSAEEIAGDKKGS